MVNNRFHKQIMGTEMEWNVGIGVVGRQHKGEFISLTTARDRKICKPNLLVNEYLPEGIEYIGATRGDHATANNNYLSNGARFYIDIGDHPEYATPENTTAKRLLLSELAGERIMANSLHRMLLHNELVEEVVIMKRGVDINGETCGYHLNISDERQSFSTQNIETNALPLVWHYASSLPMLGAGMVETYYRKNDDEDGKYQTAYRYSWGQRVLKIAADIGSNTTRERPFVNTRDEPHGNAEKMRRIHIIGVDPHILEWPAWMLFGTSSLMLAAARQGRTRTIQAPNGRENYATFIAKQATYDLEDSQKYDVLVAGKTRELTAAEINEIAWEDASKVTGMTGEQEKILQEWGQAIQDRKDDVTKLNGRSDSATKLAMLRRRQERAGRSDFDETDLMVADQNFTTVFRATKKDAEQYDAKTLYERSPANVLRVRHSADVIEISDKTNEREKAIYEPPLTTRAHVRGFFIRNWKALNLTHADWSQCHAEEKTLDDKNKYLTFKFEPTDGAPVQ